MTLNPFEKLMEEARKEVYAYFDAHIRKLPRDSEGKMKILGIGFDDNDVDAFRHAYVSGVFTQVHGEKVANYLGLANEYDPFGQYSNAMSPPSRNMDLWNNKVGRKYGKKTSGRKTSGRKTSGRKTSGRKTLLKLIHQALKNGELIINLGDPREYSGPMTRPKTLSKPIISLSKSKTGRNQTFYDLQRKIELTREEFVIQIRAGIYSGHCCPVQVIG